MLVILLNCVTLGMYQPCVDDKCLTNRCKLLQSFDDFIFAFFALEMTVKMIAMGVYGKGTYLADSWNRLDFFIVMAGSLEYGLNVENVNLTAIRTIRVLRPLRAINRIPKKYVEALRQRNISVIGYAMWEIHNQDTFFIELLKEANADMNDRNDSGQTIMHTAAKWGYTKVIEKLIELGGHVDVVDNRGCTPFMYAILCKEEETALFLLKKGARIDFRLSERKDETLLHCVAEYGLINLAKEFLFKCADDAAVKKMINSRRKKDGYTPLILAISKGRDDIANVLIAAHANINARAENGKSVLDFAIEFRLKSTIQYVMYKGVR